MRIALRSAAAPPAAFRPTQVGRRRCCTAATVVQPAERPLADQEASPASQVTQRMPSGRDAVEPPIELSAAHLARNAELVERLRGKLILAPLTRGGNVPFRRLCADFGAEATMSEMAFARFLIRDHPQERARLRRADNEVLYGVQFATNNIGEGVRAAELAAASGAAWVDLNCGCPIHEATKRGLGAALLRSPRKLARLVAGIAAGSPLPLTVKVRTGTSASKINVAETVAALHAAGAAAVTVHGRAPPYCLFLSASLEELTGVEALPDLLCGALFTARTAEQRYKRPADWGAVGAVAAARSGPVIGNGDILTHYEARRRLDGSGCLAVMTGRGALIKPWLFCEWAEGRDLDPDARDRVGIYRRLVGHMKAYFGDDARGRSKAFYFLPWHFDFFVRYRPLPETTYGEDALERPLIGRRDTSDEDLPLLERLLRCTNADAHPEIAAALWDAASDAEAVAQLEALANRCLGGWEAATRGAELVEDAVAEG